MAQNDSQLARVLGELAELGQRIGERAEQLATLAGTGSPERSETQGRAEKSLPAAETTPSEPAAGSSKAEKPRPPAAPAAGEPSSAQPPSERRPRGSRKAGRPGRRSPPSSSPRAVPPQTTAGSSRRPGRPAGPVLVSTVMHVLVLGGLAFILVSRDAKPEPFVIEAGSPVAEEIEEFLPVEVDLTAEPADQPEEQPAEFADLAIDELVPEIDAPVLVADLAAADVMAADASVVTPISFNAGDVLADLGGGGEQPARPGGGPATAPAFFGRTGQGASVCFVCDNSNSYRDGGFHTVLAELATAVDAHSSRGSLFS